MQRRNVKLHFIGHVAHYALLLITFAFTANAYAVEELKLQPLVDEALKNSPEIQASEARAAAAKFRVPQAKSLPDPMFMFGYQNEGFQRFTLGEEIGAMGMFGLSQMFFFPGKRSLKEEMAARDAQGLADLYSAAKLRLAALAAIRPGEIDADAHDRAYPERIRETIY